LTNYIGGGAAILGGAALLSACGSGDSDSNASAGSSSSEFGAVDLQLSWLFIAEWAGEYMADTNGYYKEEGLDPVKLMPGSASAATPETMVVQDRAFAAYSTMDLVAPAIAKGAPVKVVATMYQTSPHCILSMSDDPIPDPQALIGRKIGVSAGNMPTFTAFLRANNIDEGSITRVPVQNDPLPLTTGVADAWFGYFYNEPAILEDKGFDVTSFVLSDFNYRLSGNPLVVSTESIESDRDKIKAFLRASIRGQKANIADPGAGAALTVDKYGKDLKMNLAEQTLENELAIKLMINDDTRTNGLYTISDAAKEANVATLALGGNDLTVEQLFDTTLLEEMYAEDPSLI
jgi:ABC-type nitrate/sulfonate/bicarbonate transport system substrate-binding protein